MLNLALVNGFSPALGNSFPVMIFGSRTGQFATINGLAIGNPFDPFGCAQGTRSAQGTRGKQFTPAYNATNLTLNVTAAAPIPALPDSDGERHPRRAGTPRPFDCAQDTRGTDPHDPAKLLPHQQNRQIRHRDATPIRDGDRQPFDCAQDTEPIASNTPTI